MSKKLNVKVDTGRMKLSSISTRFACSRRISGPTAKDPKFEGRCYILKVCVFDWSGTWKVGKFSDNLREFTKYVGR